MKWHDCKTDPPKENGWYVLWYKRTNTHFMYQDYWRSAFYSYNHWENEKDKVYGKYGNLLKKIPYKWAEIKLED